jgi:hypothetical protein
MCGALVPKKCWTGTPRYAELSGVLLGLAEESGAASYLPRHDSWVHGWVCLMGDGALRTWLYCSNWEKRAIQLFTYTQLGVSEI